MTNRVIKLMMHISVLLLLFSNALYTQNVGKIAGVITDEETGESLTGCNVSVLGTRLGAAVDKEGYYFILNIPPGEYDLQVSMIGYTTEVLTGVIVNSGRTTNSDFQLKPTPLEGDQIVISAERPDIEPEKTSTSMVIRPGDVQQVSGMRNVSDVMDLAADVMDGHFRGGRSNEELYVLHGMGIVNPLDNSRAITQY